MTLAPGATLQQHRYVIRDVLEQNDRSVAYLADHVHLEQVLRLESLNTRIQDSDELGAHCQNWLDKGRQLSRCRHPHLAGVMDAFLEDGLPYVALEHPQGSSLRDLLQFGQPLSQEIALAYIQQVAGAVRLLHDHRIVHGNLRPETIVRSHDLDSVILTGIRLDLTDPDQRVEDVRSLAGVLWTMLTAQSVSSDLADHQVLAYRLRQSQPALAPEFEEAIAQGLAPSASVLSIQAWLSLLPRCIPSDHDRPTGGANAADYLSTPPLQSDQPSLFPIQSSMQTPNVDTPVASSAPQDASPGRPLSLTHPPVVAAPAPVSAVPPAQPTVLQIATSLQLSAPPRAAKTRSRRIPVLFTITALTAGFAGVGAGVAMRLNTPLNPINQDAALFNRDQSFPPSQQWPGDSISEVESTSGFLFERPHSNWSNDPGYYPPTSAPLAPSYVEPYDSTTVPSYEPVPEFEDPEILEEAVTVEAPVETGVPPLEPNLSDSSLPESNYSAPQGAPATNSAPIAPVQPPAVSPPPPAPAPELLMPPPSEPLKQAPVETP